MGKSNKIDEFLPTQRLIMLVGNYGSGKTEVSVNLAIQLSAQGFEVRIADLDIVNPYFRCRQAQALMERHHIRVVVPPASQIWADLPIVVPEIQGMLSPSAKGYRLFDVGGDDVGARLLSSFANRIRGAQGPLGVEAAGAGRIDATPATCPEDPPYALWQVINARRPFTDTADGCVRMMESIQRASRLMVTGLVANSHLVSETTPEVILAGWRLARQVAERTGRELQLVTAMGDLADAPGLSEVDVPIVRIERFMTPPWLRKGESDSDPPAPRPVPIGRPEGVT